MSTAIGPSSTWYINSLHAKLETERKRRKEDQIRLKELEKHVQRLEDMWRAEVVEEEQTNRDKKVQDVVGVLVEQPTPITAIQKTSPQDDLECNQN